jgi:hypothetical protein
MEDMIQEAKRSDAGGEMVEEEADAKQTDTNSNI